jgi:hypothetical protein
MQNQQQQNQRPWQESFNVLLLLANAHAICLTPFLHSGFGVRYPGMTGVVAGGLILAASSMSRDPLLGTFFWTWLAALVLQRIYALKLRRQGVTVHSAFDGMPWLLMKLGVKNEQRARIGEGFVCLLVGSLLMEAGTLGLGQFIMLGCLSLPVLEAIKRRMRYQQVLSSQDALLEMQMYQERVHGNRQDY